MDVDGVLDGLYELIATHLTEKQRRLLAGAAARALGRGGGARMARISGLSRPTVYAGVRELDEPPDPRGRIRRPGGGPKRLVERDPGLLPALDELVDPDTRGDPESPLRWTCKSTRQLADALSAQGFQVSDDTVGRLLKQQRYTLQRTLKTEEGAQQPDRDAQFRYINQQAKAHLADGQPVGSVDTKKKELVGRYANGGAEWRPSGRPAGPGVLSICPVGEVGPGRVGLVGSRHELPGSCGSHSLMTTVKARACRPIILDPTRPGRTGPR